MTPRTDDYEFDNNNLSATDDDEDDDEGLKEDMAALARACMISGHREEDEIPVQDDPLLTAGDAIVPVVSDDDDDESDLECLKRVQSMYKPLDSLPPLPSPPPPTLDDDDDEDDFETVRAIFKRFSAYDVGNGRVEEKLADGDHALSSSGAQEVAKSSTSDKSDADELYPDSQYPCEDTNTNLLTEQCGFGESYETGACLYSELPQKRSSFPPSAQALIDAVKKNRALQKFLRSKLIEFEAKIEENKQLRDKVKLLKDFQVSCSRRTGNALSLKRDPRVQLISAKKSSVSSNSKSHKKAPAMCYGPAENSRVATYKMVMERFPLSFDRKKWSNVERQNLSNGLKQQFQDKISVDGMSSECSVTDLEISPERTRELLPVVNWVQLASMYVADRTGAECESRWLNCENTLINHGAWTGEEDRSLLIIVQEMGTRNWFDIAVSLATNRTPYQCLARYQRSLNPSMLNSQWTEEEDVQLCSAVAEFGVNDWQSVASVLERRTGTQCSNRWKKSLCPIRKGSFTPEEDQRLTVAVMLFGQKWNQIAKYVPGRSQSQCRDRYLNSLDPSLKWGGWTEEEDFRLEAAIAKHGYCWTKVAEDVPPRTDSQCRKRWKVLCPEQLLVLQEARKKQKSLVLSNFVDRESERPKLTLNDFNPLQMVASTSDIGAVIQRKRKRKSNDVPKKVRSKKRAKEAELCSDDVQDAAPKKERPKRRSRKAAVCPEEGQSIVEYSDGVKTCGGAVPFFALRNVPKKMRSKRGAKKAYPNVLEDIACGDKVKPCIESSKSQDLENTTLACFLGNRSKKRLSKYVNNASQASFSTKTKVLPEQVENQIPSGEQEKDLSVSVSVSKQKKVASCRQVRKPERAIAVRKPENTNNVTVNDDDDMTLASLVRNKSKKLSQATERRQVCSSSKLKKGSVLLHGNNPTTITDGSGPSASKIVEEEIVLHGGVAEAKPTNINVVEEDNILPGVAAEPSIEEKDDSSFLQNKIGKRQRRHKTRNCSCCQ